MNVDRVIRGIGVSAGVAVGPARVVQWELPTITRRGIAPDEVDAELARLREAVGQVRELLVQLRERTLDRAGEEEAKIFDAQILMLEDPEFMRDVENLVRENQLSAERAFEFKTLEMRALWGQSTSRLLRERVYDLNGIQLRVLGQLLGHSVDQALHSPDGRAAVVFTRELSPGLTVQFEQQHVSGFASEEGTRTAHAAILARSMGIPCVMGLVGGLSRIEEGQDVLLDGSAGIVVLDPTPEEVEQARERERARVALGAELEAIGDQPAVTRDQVRVSLRGNLDLPEDLSLAVQNGAEGVGLLRTEFLILGRAGMPTEDEQAGFFARVAQRFPGHPVVVRSYDVGGDKFPASFRPPTEANPFLGWRAIRVCLDEPEVFRTQIRAVLRARVEGDVQLMLPFVTDLAEIERTRELVAESRRELEHDGVPCAPDLPVGVMIETPAALALADRIAARSDFLSVGTNDLTQYMLAVDRGNARLAARFQTLHPAVLRALADIAEAGSAAGLAVSVCGEMASEPMAAFLLVGLGYRVLSVAPGALPLVRWSLRQVDAASAVHVATAALDTHSAREAAAVLREGFGRFVDVPLPHASRLPGGTGEFTFNER